MIINTGTWLKILRRVPAHFGLLPAICYPTFRPNYFKVREADERITVDYAEVVKELEGKQTLLQRALIFGRKPKREKMIHARTVLKVTQSKSVPPAVAGKAGKLV